MRVRDLENWPPEPCGVYKRSFVSPSAEQAIIKKVLHMYDIWITFSCEFEGEDHTYDFQTHDKITPPKLKEILENSIGKSLISIGEIEIPAVKVTLASLSSPWAQENQDGSHANEDDDH
jgi:hypothetical protein